MSRKEEGREARKRFNRFLIIVIIPVIIISKVLFNVLGIGQVFNIILYLAGGVALIVLLGMFIYSSFKKDK